MNYLSLLIIKYEFFVFSRKIAEFMMLNWKNGREI